MTRKRISGTALLLLALLASSSCRTSGADYGGDGRLVLPRLRQGAAAPTPNAELTGTLERDGDRLRIGGNGNTIVVWPRTANARSSPGNGTIVIIWPRSATLEQRRGGGGTVVVIWPRSVGLGTPVRVGERVALIGAMVDDVAALPLDRRGAGGGGGPAFVVREFRPAGTDFTE